MENVKAVNWLIIPESVVLCALLVSLQLAPQDVAVEVDSNKAWQQEKAFTQIRTQGPFNAVSMGDDASWFCCCYGNSCTWPNLFRLNTPKAAFPSAASIISFSVQNEKIEPIELFTQRYSLPYKLFGTKIGKGLLLEFLFLLACARTDHLVNGHVEDGACQLLPNFGEVHPGHILFMIRSWTKWG